MTKSAKQSVDFKPLFDYIDQRISESEEKFDDKISHLPNKDDFFSRMDEMLVEIKKAREDLAAHKLRHETIDEDTTGLKKNINNLYKVFELDQPVIQPAI